MTAGRPTCCWRRRSIPTKPIARGAASRCTEPSRTDPTTPTAHERCLSIGPYYGEQGDGVGQFFSWELAYLQFLEREGYDVTYATNVDIDRYPDLLLSHKAFLSVGHDEVLVLADARQRGSGARPRR